MSHEYDYLHRAGWCLNTPVHADKGLNMVVSRVEPPYSSSKGDRYWYGKTLKDAITMGCLALKLSVPPELG